MIICAVAVALLPAVGIGAQTVAGDPGVPSGNQLSDQAKPRPYYAPDVLQLPGGMARRLRRNGAL